MRFGMSALVLELTLNNPGYSAFSAQTIQNGGLKWDVFGYEWVDGAVIRGLGRLAISRLVVVQELME